MNDEPSPHSFLKLRILAILVALGPAILLIAASRLNPNPDGLGTHQQLGLPPCTSRVILGIRCPSCGMTTSWAYFMHGQWIESARANVGGFLLAIVAILTVAGAMATAFRPHVHLYPSAKSAAVAAIAIFSVTLVDWLVRLAD